MKTVLELDPTSLSLYRYPQRNNETLQAWDAGDEYIINHFTELSLPETAHIVILNDNFGALSCWFSNKYRVTVMSDSFISHQAIQHNLDVNNCNPIQILTTMDPIPSDADMVLMQLPKNNRHLIWQLSQLNTSLLSDCKIIAVSKVKNIHTSTLKLFEKYLGNTTTSLAWKKHRLVFSEINKLLNNTADESITWNVENEDIELTNLSNVFSRESLDLGARFLLNHLPVNPDYQDIIDLGCGNGVLSVKLARLNPQARIISVDESYMAVKSTELNFTKNIGSSARLNAFANNCLDNVADQSVDCIVCNPPFHQQNTITDHIAWQMFCDSHWALKEVGELYVIGNRHLNYDEKLVRIFGKKNVKTIAQNNKFVILQATK